MKQLNKREKILISVLIIVGTIYIFNKYLYQPVLNETEAVRQENTQLTNAVKALQSGEKLDIGQEKEIIRAEYQRLASRVPDEAFIPETINFIENVAGEVGADIWLIQYRQKDSNLKSNNSATSKAYSKIIVEKEPQLIASEYHIIISGGYSNICSFLEAVENNSRIFSIDKLAMSQLDDENIMVDFTVANYHDNNTILGIKGIEAIPYESTQRDNPFK